MLFAKSGRRLPGQTAKMPNPGGGAVMERGPLALFGAIIAVGLGPAMWVGAQFGVTGTTPNPRPPVAVVDRVQAPGGAGAGSTPERTTDEQVSGTDAQQPRRTTRRAPKPIPEITATTPSTPAPSARPSASSSAPSTEPTEPTEPSTTLS